MGKSTINGHFNSYVKLPEGIWLVMLIGHHRPISWLTCFQNNIWTNQAGRDLSIGIWGLPPQPSDDPVNNPYETQVKWSKVEKLQYKDIIKDIQQQKYQL
jgi:hypothetical protein